MGDILYLECNMGAAGDMLSAALYELLSEEKKNEFREIMNQKELGIRVEPEVAEKCGVQGTYMKVEIHGEEELSHEHHHHASLQDVYHMIEHYSVEDAVKVQAKAVYEKIAEAESHAHGKKVEEIHFHEVGMKDAIADVMQVCWAVAQLAPEKVIVSPINVGYGTVKCAHGILPVPAPATAHLLQGAPIYQGQIEGEMCTPTGAALLQTMHTEFGRMPMMKVRKTGYGMGKKDFPVANCVRAMLGELAETMQGIQELSCNIDDMTGEEMAYVTEKLMQEGALDVYTVSLGMKKGRAGIKLVCMTKPEDSDRLAQVILQHTTSWGVRKQTYDRYFLQRHIETIETTYGEVRVKRGTGYGVDKWKAEYEDVARVAKENGISVREVENLVAQKMQ